MSETIAIIGAGKVGGNLGRRLARAGYVVRFGVREPSRASEAVEDCPGSVAVSPADAAREASVVLLTVPGNVALSAATSLGDLTGKIVVDCANPIRWDAGPVWSPPEEGSLAAAIAAHCPGARVVKAFNTFGAEFHLDPELEGGPAQVQMAGNDAAAKDTVAAIARAAGFAPIDAGPLRNASVLENLAVLWIHLAMVGGQGRDFVFQMVRRRR